MTYFKKITCLALCFIYTLGVLGLTGCQSVNTEASKTLVKESVSKITEAVRDRDYESLSAYLYEEDDDLRKAFKLGEGIDDENTVAVRKAIASTFAYLVHEETLQYSFFNKIATVNVNFMVVDYEKFAESNVYYRNVEHLEESLTDYNNKNQLIYTLPMRFVIKDGKALLENTELLEQFFAFADFDKIVFGESLINYLGDHTFVDSEDGVYDNPDSLTLKIDLKEDGRKFDWKYDYEVAYTGEIGGEEVLFTKSDETKHGSESIQIRYSSNTRLESGRYRITILYGGDKTDYECTVEMPDKRYSGSDSFICPKGDTLSLLPSDIVIKTPEGYHFVDEGTSLGDEIIDTYGRNITEFIVSDDDSDKSKEFMYGVYASDFNHTTEDQVIDYFASLREYAYKQSGAEVKTKKGKIKIGRKKYKMCDLKAKQKDVTITVRLRLVPAPNGYHLIFIIARSDKALKTYTSMLH